MFDVLFVIPWKTVSVENIIGVDQESHGRFYLSLQFIIIFKKLLLIESQRKVTVEYFFQFNNRISLGNNKKDKSIHHNGANNFPLNSR